MWWIWREIGQPSRKRESEDGSGPKSKHERLCKTQIAHIKMKQGLAASENHHDHATHCSALQDCTQGTLHLCSQIFPWMQIPCTWEAKLHQLKWTSQVKTTVWTGAAIQLSWVPRLQGIAALLCWKVVDHEGNVRAGRVASGYALSWVERQEQGAEGDTQSPKEKIEVFRVTMTHLLTWAGNIRMLQVSLVWEQT